MYKITELLDKFEHHLLNEHPDPDMTEPCKYKQDVAYELLTYLNDCIGSDEEIRSVVRPDQSYYAGRRILRAEIRHKLGIDKSNHKEEDK